jgi:uridylate kinase
MKVSISLGGSLITKNMSCEVYKRYANVLIELRRRGHKLVVVCGGGHPAREYIRMGKELSAPDSLLDRLGILSTHINALLMIAALGEAADIRIHRRSSEIKKNLNNKILVGGGHKPGSSTDYRAVLFADAIDADLIINATDYGGVFDKDPSKYSDAEQYDRITYDELELIIKQRFEQMPGDYGLFDLKAVKKARKIDIPIIIIDGTDPLEILRGVEGSHGGTLVSSQ